MHSVQNQRKKQSDGALFSGKMTARLAPKPPAAPARPGPGAPLAIAILAGGLGTRMGRDKSTLPLGSKTLLQHIRRTARQTGRPVLVVRRDWVPRCGPLGGIHTAFRRCPARAILFLACDMPFVTPALLARISRSARTSDRPVFTFHRGLAGFPFVLRRKHLVAVNDCIAKGLWSLQALARSLRARSLTLGHAQAAQLMNLNNPKDWAKARRHWNRLGLTSGPHSKTARL